MLFQLLICTNYTVIALVPPHILFASTTHTFSHMSNYYQVLGLNSSASEDEIKKSYKKLAVKYHPDKTRDTSHHEKFLQIQQAYETLKSPDARIQYDRDIGAQAQSYSYARYAPESSYYSFLRHFSSHFRDTQAAAREMRAKQREAEAAAEELRAQQRAAAQAAQQAHWNHQRRHREDLERQQREEFKRREEEAELRKREYYDDMRRKQAETQQQSDEQNRMDAEIRSEWEAARKRKEAEKVRRQKDDEAEERILHAIFNEKEVSRDSPRGQRLVARIRERIFTVRMDLKRAGMNDDDNEAIEEAVLQEFLRQSSRVKGEYSNSSYSEGTDSEHPIIVEDDPPQSVHPGSEDRGPRNYPQTPTSENAGESDTASLEEQSPHAYDENEQEKSLRMEDLHQFFDLPNRPRKDTRRPHKRSMASTPSAKSPETKSVPNASGKRAKTSRFDFDDLKSTLNADIGNVDFGEILESLPQGNVENGINGSPRQRRASGDRSPKRQRFSEYTDGSSKADTLFTPVNKTPLKGHRPVITMLDLHASPSVHRYVPPPPPTMTVESPQDWALYVEAIKRYEREFLQYKKHIIQYQFERQQKDEQYYEEINLNMESFAVYERCLRRDVVVMEEYTRAASVYRYTMSDYRRKNALLQEVDV